MTRHAGATRAELLVEPRGDELELTVRDDGEGFAGAPPMDGGIRGMRERALLVRGTLSVESNEGSGTEVRLLLPVDER